MKEPRRTRKKLNKRKCGVTETTIKKKKLKITCFQQEKKNKGPEEEERWLIDSGCTNHMTPNEKIFVRINTSINVPIRVGN